MTTPRTEAELDAVIAEALAPYQGWLSRTEAAVMQALLADALATHPATSELVEQLGPAPELDGSGTIRQGAEGGEGAAGEGSDTDDDAAAG
ncbi:MAG: hypothetical protein KC731_39070 [Myxococcales bacterium]|nr:hypothetical protein [Myxococcales bacterium]